MPKAAPEDHRPARAVLHAPYPLPFIITRPPSLPTLSAPVLPTASHEVTIPLPPASIADFPLFKHDWRKVEPAFPPIPYPLVPREEKLRKRVKKLHILKMRKSGEDSSEWEVMSHRSNGISEDDKELLGLTKQVGKISADGELDEDDPNQDENNLLIYAFVSSYQRGEFDSPDSHDDPPEPLTPTQANPFPQNTPSIHEDPPFALEPSDRQDTPRPASPGNHSPLMRVPTPFPEFSSIEAGPPVKPVLEVGPAWDVVSDAVSSFWSDGTDADEADQESEMRGTPVTHTLVTPSATASRECGSGKAKKRAHSPDRPLFLGQTNQVPFTFVPPPKKAPSQSSISDGSQIFNDGGYISETGSVRTIRQIPRSRVNRMRVREREKRTQIKRERSTTPKQRDYQRSNVNITPQPPAPIPIQPAGPPTVSSFGQPFNFPIQNIPMPVPQQFIPQSSMFGLDSFLFAPIAPLLRTSEVLSSPTSNGGGPSNIVQNQVPNSNGREPSWSPQPMSIDPRTAESQLQTMGVSWPHALPEREQIVPSNASSLLQRLENGNGDVDVPMPTALSRITQPQPQAQAGPSRTKVSRRALAEGEGEEMVPFGKACHNFLHLRRRAADRRRKNRVGGGEKKGGNGLLDILTESENDTRNRNRKKVVVRPAIRVQQATPVQTHPSFQPQPQPQPQQIQQNQPEQWNPNTNANTNTNAPMGFITPNDPNFQAQAQFAGMYANMYMYLAQMQAQDQNQIQGQRQQPMPMPYNIGMPMRYYPPFNGVIHPQWGLNPPNPNMFASPRPQQNQGNTWTNQAQQTLAPPPPPQNSIFGFPTPGATPHAPTPKPPFNPFTPRSPVHEEDRKPLRKRMRSTISPSSANDLMLRNRATPKPFGGGLMPPAEIWEPERRSANVHRETTDEVDMDMENWGGLIDIAQVDEARNRDERRNRWVREERERVGSMGVGRKGKGKEVLR
ncbi:hypothetical protein I302_107393 [Kwoniella bestiolae CBS 10118]|uniref:Uncharacterized protein n=1 Tax=Kwoniella bestiolae CBS 10118 TaxID=1296100 RepID=A0A1B9FYN1_9TREE|nr:hypothetical protein I302_06869 [Kwoniella bestiolae CBS 10118]OCF23883.1 hypothetical protein I302_06869 [Kwoniella bestiolae CBS 10118]